ncbi:Leucine-rich repeat receptor-like serine/threonine-protein kinase At1g17230 [Linum grandiflorum]
MDNLSFLKVLKLYDNIFIGGIPLEIGRRRRLQELLLYNNSLGGLNNLTGSIPHSFNNLSSLETLLATRYQLSGRIPAALGHLLLYEWIGKGEEDANRVRE